MKSEQLFYALTGIHDRFIEEAAGAIPKPNRQVYLRYGVLAASLLLVCGLGGLSLRGCGATGGGNAMPSDMVSGTHDNVSAEDDAPLLHDDAAWEGGTAAEGGVLPSEAPDSPAAAPQDAGAPANLVPPVGGTETAPPAPRPAASAPQNAAGSRASSSVQPKIILPQLPAEQSAPYSYDETQSTPKESTQTETENDDAALQTAKSYSAGAAESAGAQAASNALPQADIQYYPTIPLLSLAEGRLSAARKITIDLSAYPETGTLQYQDCYTLENTESFDRTISLLYSDAEQVSITANGVPLRPADMKKYTIPAGSSAKIVFSGSKTLSVRPGNISRLEVISVSDSSLDFTSQSAVLVPCPGLAFDNQNFGFDLTSGKLSVSLQTEEPCNFLEFSCP